MIRRLALEKILKWFEGVERLPYGCDGQLPLLFFDHPVSCFTASEETEWVVAAIRFTDVRSNR